MIYLVTNRLGVTPESAPFESVGLEAIKSVMDEPRLQIDTETTGFDPHTGNILSVQIGTETDQYVIDVLRFSPDVIDSVLCAVFDGKVLYFHNAKFDLKWLFKYPKTAKLLRSRRIEVRDSYLAECLLTAGEDEKERKVGLKDVCMKYLGVEMSKEVRGAIHREGLSERVIVYAATDVMHLFDVHDLQEKRIEELKMIEVMLLENAVVKVFADMEYKGVKIDLVKWNSVIQQVKKDLETVEKELDSMVLEDRRFDRFKARYVQLNMFGFEERSVTMNWASPAQKLNLLRTIEPSVHDTADATMQKLKKKHPIIPKMIEHSKLAKIKSSFGEEFLTFVNPVTGRVHPDYWQILSTGRISVSKPNVNQIPAKGELGKKIRECFIVEDGYSMVGGDYSGMELRIIAELSKDPLWLEAFNSGMDLHSVLCSKTFGIDIKDVKTEPPFKKGTTYRDIQKTVSFGLAYGMSKYKLSDTMQIPLDVAEKVINDFFEIVPGVKKFLDTLGRFGVKNGYIRTPLGRRRFFPQWKKLQDDPDSNFKLQGEIERASKNMPIQGTNGDIIKIALVEAYNNIQENNRDCHIILSVYDEIRTECADEQAEEWRTVLEKTMIAAADLLIRSVPVVVDCSITKTWEK